jgi:hypothetical protein
MSICKPTRWDPDKGTRTEDTEVTEAHYNQSREGKKGDHVDHRPETPSDSAFQISWGFASGRILRGNQLLIACEPTASLLVFKEHLAI